MKASAPSNSLGIYLTNKRLQNTQIFEKTGIPDSDLSKMRNGEIESIPAIRLYLISLVTRDPIGEVLKKIFPDLKLKESIKPFSKKIKGDTTALGKIILSLEDYNLDILSYKTGIKRDRLLRLTKLERERIDAHELYLIEMATDRDPGTLFEDLFGDLKLK